MAINESCTGDNCVAITGTASGSGSVGVLAKGEAVGVRGDGKNGFGVAGFSESTAGGVGVQGYGKIWHGVAGFCESRGSGGVGVYGKNLSGGTGVLGESDDTGNGVFGRSAKGDAVVGITNAEFFEKAGVVGISQARNGHGVRGLSINGKGVWGLSNGGTGVEAESFTGTALIATARGTNTTALIVNQWGTGNIIIGRDNRNAEVFRVLNNGDVQVRGVTLASDKNSKENFSSVNTIEILDNLSSMPIQSWNYTEDSSSVRHIGPTAQDFQATFGLNGDDDIHISSIDLQGVALAAIQGLNEKLKAENAQLHASLANLEARLSALEAKG